MTHELDRCPPGEVCLEVRGGAPRPPGGTCAKLSPGCGADGGCACLGEACAPNVRCSFAAPDYLVCACVTCP